MIWGCPPLFLETSILGPERKNKKKKRNCCTWGDMMCQDFVPPRCILTYLDPLLRALEMELLPCNHLLHQRLDMILLIFSEQPSSKGIRYKALIPSEKSQLSRDKDGCTPNSVPMVFIVFNLGILGDNLPINTH